MSKPRKSIPAEDDQAAQVGRHVAALMRERGLSQKDVAAALGVQVVTVSAMLNGRGVDRFLRLADLARVLGVTPNDVVMFDKGRRDPEEADLFAAAMEGVLMESGWSEARAEAVVELAREAARERAILNLDRRLSAKALAATRLRDRAPEE